MRIIYFVCYTQEKVTHIKIPGNPEEGSRTGDPSIVIGKRHPMRHNSIHSQLDIRIYLVQDKVH